MQDNNRVAIFIDGNYLNKVLEQTFNRVRIDYNKLVEELTGNIEILRTYYYNCLPWQSNTPTEEETKRMRASQQFYSALQALPRFNVRLGKLAYRGTDSNGRPIYVQKRVDVLLCVDLLQLVFTKQINHIILVAGDSDFVPVIEVVKTCGVITTLCHGPLQAGANNTVHQELWNICDERHELTSELLEKVKLYMNDKACPDETT